jgi:hypothetical protein
VIVSDEDFDEVVRADLQVLKQVWADMDKCEKPFTHVIKSKKKNKQLARSTRQPYNTHSRGVVCHRSLSNGRGFGKAEVRILYDFPL